MTAIVDPIGPQSTMQQVLELFPGAQRALFRGYHIGGCSSCGFQPAETLEQLCRRNNNLDVSRVIEHIKSSHDQDAKMLVSPDELARLRAQNPALLKPIAILWTRIWKSESLKR